MNLPFSSDAKLIDGHGRQITYLRMSVTDRCDFRCLYCMTEKPKFIAKSALLTLEELHFIARAFTELGVNKIRLTGGEPLVRKNILSLCRRLSELPLLSQLAMTTNGSQLTSYAPGLQQAGVRRINVSLDSLNENKFRAMTRTGRLDRVLDGIKALNSLPSMQVKINAVIQNGQNEDEIIDLVNFALQSNIDISFIEEMPLGLMPNRNRQLRYFSSEAVRGKIEAHYRLLPATDQTGGPSRYFRIPSFNGTRIGFISPHSQNFCGHCNRVRLTAEGRLLLCLGQENSVDLRATVRHFPGDIERLKTVIVDAMASKPEKHHFTTDNQVYILRFMNMTGG